MAVKEFSEGSIVAWHVYLRLRNEIAAGPRPVKELMKDGKWLVPAESRPVSPEIKRIAERIRARR